MFYFLFFSVSDCFVWEYCIDMSVMVLNLYYCIMLYLTLINWFNYLLIYVGISLNLFGEMMLFLLLLLLLLAILILLLYD